MLERFSIRMTTKERQALQKLADLAMRDFREQARVMILNELISHGLLDAAEYLPKAESEKGDGANS
jgi:hypothetical protein